MRTLKFWMLLCLSLCASVAFARKGYVEQKIYVTHFDELEIGATYVATFEKSNTYEIVLDVPEQLMTFAQTKVVNEKVILTFDTGRMSRSEQRELSEHRPYVRIKAPSIRELTLYGATTLNLKGDFNLGEVDLEMSGASTFEAGKLKAKKLEMEISGASVVKVRELVADNLELEISGASNCNFSSVEAKEMEVDLSGASKLAMRAYAKNADVDVSGMSNMDWQPLNKNVGERLEIEVSGMSKVNASSVRFRKVDKEVSGMSKLKIGR